MTGLEGFFVLESSVDDDLENILTADMNRDRAEKSFVISTRGQRCGLSGTGQNRPRLDMC